MVNALSDEMSGSCKCGIKKTSRIVGGSETEVKLVFHSLVFLFLCLFVRSKKQVGVVLSSETEVKILF